MSFHPDTLTRSYPPTSSHEPGKCTVPKAVERLCPGYEKFLPFSKRPRFGRSVATLDFLKATAFSWGPEQP